MKKAVLSISLGAISIVAIAASSYADSTSNVNIENSINASNSNTTSSSNCHTTITINGKTTTSDNCGSMHVQSNDGNSSVDINNNSNNTSNASVTNNTTRTQQNNLQNDGENPADETITPTPEVHNSLKHKTKDTNKPTHHNFFWDFLNSQLQQLKNLFHF